MKRYAKVLVPLFAISEMIAIVFAAYLAVYIRYGFGSFPNIVHENVLYISAVLWPSLASASGYYKDRRTRKFINTFSHLTIQWFFISFILFAYLVLAKLDVSRLSFSLFLILSYFLLIVSGRIRHQFLEKIRTRGMNQRSIGFIGIEKQYSIFCSWLHDNPSFGFQPTRLMEIGFSESQDESAKKLEQMFSVYHFDEILVGSFERRKDVLTVIVDIAEEYGCRVRIEREKEDIYSRHLDLHQFGPFRVFSVREEPLARTPNKVFKRIFDVFFSSLFLLFIFWWIHLIVCALIKLTSKGPIFFKQKRVGKNGVEFYCYKFRTMEENGSTCEGKGEITKQIDSRITPIGSFLRKTNLDEFPQFINVLLGDMSVIGPRPHMLEEDYKVAEVLSKYRIRRFIRPGISGWAQVNGFRGGTEDMELMQKRVDYDVAYIESWTPLLDLKIMYLTILQMLTFKTGAH